MKGTSHPTIDVFEQGISRMIAEAEKQAVDPFDKNGICDMWMLTYQLLYPERHYKPNKELSFKERLEYEQMNLIVRQK
jgi:hypothetical protein